MIWEAIVRKGQKVIIAESYYMTLMLIFLYFKVTQLKKVYN